MDFDIFISFKATHHREPTDDAKYAKQLYDELIKQGYKVFFSPTTIIENGRSDYKKEVDNALEKSRLLIVVSTKIDFINSKWVEYEWKTFHDDILSNVKNNAQIITFTGGIDTRELPRALRYVQNFEVNNMSSLISFTTSFFFGNNAEKSNTGFSGSHEAINSFCHDHSFYNSGWSGEYERLKLDSASNYNFDMVTINKAKSILKHSKYNVLVIGCAYGFVASTRFGLDDEAENVVCIDYNEDVIQKAREMYADYPHMKFYNVNVESSNYTESIISIKEELGIAEFDIVFASNILKYLNNPSLFIRNTRKFMNKGNVIILREGDDESKIAHPDPKQLLKRIVTETKNISGMPDYSMGRELPALLKKNGYFIHDISCDMKQNSQYTFEQKEESFQKSFCGRRNVAKNRLSVSTTQRETAAINRFIDTLDEFENIFYDIWYSEFDFVCIAEKE